MKKMEKTILAASLALMVAISTVSQAEADSPKLSAQQILKIKQAANQGDTQAQYNLGFMYYEGEGVPQDYAKAVEWYQKAANQGNTQAQYNLGFMYYKGEVGVDISQENEEICWLRSLQGRPETADFYKAKQWFKKSCDNGLEKGCQSYLSLVKRMQER